MLSYMRDDKNESLTQQECSKSDSIENKQQLPEDQYFTVSQRAKNAKNTTILLTVFFAIGLACLALMIKSSSVKIASAANNLPKETQIEETLNKLIGVKSEMTGGMEKLVKKFNEFSTVKQVELQHLKQNPFDARAFISGFENIIDADKLALAACTTAENDFQLLSIMQSQGNEADRCCIINDKILWVGDSLEGFVVKEIRDDCVLIKSQDAEISLTLSEAKESWK